MPARKSQSKSPRKRAPGTAAKKAPAKKAGVKKVAAKQVSAPPAPAAEDTYSPSPLPQANPSKQGFNPETLDRTVIAVPLLRKLREEDEKRKENPDLAPQVHPVVIDLNLNFEGGREKARDWIVTKTAQLVKDMKRSPSQGINVERSRLSQQYLFGKLDGDVIRQLVKDDLSENARRVGDRVGSVAGTRAIYHVWPDFPVHRLSNRSIRTVKADAAHASFSAFGDEIVWAVIDSGVDAAHPHFAAHRNLDLPPPLQPVDFTGEGLPLADPFGHGTHVAGIIAGEMRSPAGPPNSAAKGRARRRSPKADAARVIHAFARNRDDSGETTYDELKIDHISGMAPKCKILSLRVLDASGSGDTSSIIAAIAHIQELNGHGRRLLVHGVNISIGNAFEPEWFACGQSPLCVEVNRLVSSGVVVVVAAGNTGYGTIDPLAPGPSSAGLQLTVNDPGNADHAITVGSTHRDMPHVYGVSYFSSKGPTGDGRLKPDLVAPGEKIISCAAGEMQAEFTRQTGRECNYIEDSGTSMAAPHVSGVIAAFLSVRREFVGQPEEVKRIFLETATDLGRERYFQGRGLVDLMRAIQAV